MHYLFTLILVILGGIGAGLSFWYPAHKELSADQHMGFGCLGILWLCACFALAINFK